VLPWSPGGVGYGGILNSGLVCLYKLRFDHPNIHTRRPPCGLVILRVVWRKHFRQFPRMELGHCCCYDCSLCYSK
jgi:hypothetical protein